MQLLGPFVNRAHILRRLYRRVGRAHLGMVASSVAFFGFLAIFPAIAAIIALWGFAADPGIIREQLAPLQDVLPTEAYGLLYGQVENLLALNSRRLGWTTALSTALALWSARAGVAALLQGINMVHHQPARRGLWHVALASLLTLILIGTAIAAMTAAVVAPIVIGLLNLGTATALILEVANIALGLTLLVVGLGLAYRYGPNRGAGRRQKLLFAGGAWWRLFFGRWCRAAL